MLATSRPISFVMTRDRAVAEPFYRDILRLAPITDDGFAAVFAFGDGVLRMTQLPDFVASPHPVLGWHVDDIAACIDELAVRGVSFLHFAGFEQDWRGIWTAPDGIARVAWFNDPDGNMLSLTDQRKD